MDIPSERRRAACNVLRVLRLNLSDELIDFADTVLLACEDAIAYGEFDEDAIHELADQCVPVYNDERLAIVSSAPKLWLREPEIEPTNPTPVEIAGLILYDIAREIVNDRLEATKGERR